MSLDCRQIEAVFNAEFAESEHTRLCGGGEEPVYLPSLNGDASHRIIYRLDYAASALHEVAHWCVAGETRRRMLDYGYWYEPDGRSFEQQRQFIEVEVKPQALEWLFCYSARRDFRISFDNHDLDPESISSLSECFCKRVSEQAQAYLIKGLPSRAARFACALAALSGVHWPPLPKDFKPLPSL